VTEAIISISENANKLTLALAEMTTGLSVKIKMLDDLVELYNSHNHEVKRQDSYNNFDKYCSVQTSSTLII